MNKNINIAITGIGYWGPNILRSFNRVKDVNIKYVCDLNETKLKQFQGL